MFKSTGLFALHVFAICLMTRVSLAHPMDLGALQIQILEDRLVTDLRLHTLTADRFLGTQDDPKNEDDLEKLKPSLFSATLGSVDAELGGDHCSWRKPELKFDQDRQYLILSGVAVCLKAIKSPFSLNFPMNFLTKAAPSFQLMVRAEGYGEPYTFVADSKRTDLQMGVDDVRSFGGFLKMGMSHIGAAKGEWVDQQGRLHFPEGIDHILFVLALILGGGTLWGILKCVTGFTLGHSLTLGLSAFKVIHVHSRWVEAFIALSIAYVAGEALVRPRAAHRWIVATLFGTVHGLAFAGALQELELTRDQLLPALFGFNLGVELGQCLIILLVVPVFMLMKKVMGASYIWPHRVMALSLVLVGSFWFYQRAFG